WLATRPVLRWTARLLPPVTIALIVAQLTGMVGSGWWLLPVMVAAALSFSAAGRHVHAVFERAFARQGVLAQYPARLVHGPRDPAYPTRLLAVGAQLLANGVPWLAGLPGLVRRMRLSELRSDGIVRGIVQMLTLWDYHGMDRLEAWQARCGRQVRTWL